MQKSLADTAVSAGDHARPRSLKNCKLRRSDRSRFGSNKASTASRVAGPSSVVRDLKTDQATTRPRDEVTASDGCARCCSSTHTSGERSGAGDVLRRRVRFEMASVAVHEIVPYSELYGVHPRYFDFDKNYYMIPAFIRGPRRAALVGMDDEDSDGSSDDEFD